ncbi:MAG: hypothetical protein PHO26_06960 [Dehalococcoidia bacterium]|nr:hypothetical protein [Dehalococcoidia bacterium]MDD5493397.1 hypothetical protein [Dehalococcoidia bacterium]
MRQFLLASLVILLITTGCVYLPAGSESDTGQPPIITTFSASPDAISPGSRSQLSWAITGARSITIDNDIGSVALRGTRTVIPSVTTTYTLTASNMYGTSTASAQVIVTGTSTPSGSLPSIISFTVTPDTISSGGSAVLNWNISGANSASIEPGIGSVNAISGTRAVTPAGTTTYVLTATNSAGSVPSHITLAVAGSAPAEGLPVITYFEANPNIIPFGGSTTLSWNTSNATTVNIISGGGSMAVVDVSGNLVTTPAASTTFTLQATNSSGWVSKTISVVVGGGGADTTAPSIPIQLTPVEGATLPQPSSPWSFDWSDSTDVESGIQQYHIYVIRAGAGSPVIDTYTASSNYSKTVGGAITSAYLNNWTWKVRAQNNVGIWSDWSPVRTFNVEPPPAASHTVTLSPVASETGAVYKDGSVATGTKFVGDTSANSSIRCYFSYDISALAGKDVTSAKLNFTVNNIVRDPFAHLGGLWVGKVSYGIGPLQASDYSIASSPFTSALASPPVEMNITSSVKSAVLASNQRYQVRLHFATETNSDNLADYINFSNALLTITYND